MGRPSSRIFAIDVLGCAGGGRLRFIATIEDPSRQWVSFALTTEAAQ
jgi:hypothetical protein